MDRIKTASGQAARKRGLLINRDFTLLWSAQAISKLGDVVFDYTLVFWIATSIAREQRWAPLAVSGIFVATALPTLGASPIDTIFTVGSLFGLLAGMYAMVNLWGLHL
ncbi:MAG TPA: hypothetical protein VF026_08680, partial [Ktedonobacteraceae bacterium]